jgi:hypothetical protein
MDTTATLFGVGSNVKRVLRVTATRLYIRADGSQTREFDEAVNLPDVPSAIEMCRKHKLEGMELVLRVGAPEYDVVTPLGRLT